MSYDNIYIDKEDQIATLVIDRPKKLNALNRETLEEIHQAFNDIQEDPDTRVIILTGSGEKAFVAGADISEFAHYSREEGRELSASGQRKVFDKIAHFPKPVIAAVNGFALGGGLELAMAAHFRLASENAKLGLPETSLGLIPGYGGTQRLTQLVGKGLAMEMIMTAGMIKATKALDYGLVNHVVPLEELMDQTLKIADKILMNSTVALTKAIAAINAYEDKSINGYVREIESFGKSFETSDFKEGTTAFLKKRKANFPGE